MGPAGGPVELVRQEQVAEDGPVLIFHGAGGFVVHGEAHDVRGQHVRGELDPVVFEAQGFTEGQGHGGLAHAGDILEEDVPPGQDRKQRHHQHAVLAHHRFLHFVQDAFGIVHIGPPASSAS